MHINIQEDSRTLREFYPDLVLRHQVHYAFAHQFLPGYVQQNPYAFYSALYRQDPPGGVTDPTRFIHSRWSAVFEQRAGLARPRGDIVNGGMVLRRVTDLSMSIQAVGGRASALVQMPTPEQPPEAHFVCIVFLPPTNVQARVFTLEAMSTDAAAKDKRGVICEWAKEGKHNNFALSIPAERSLFLRALEALLQSPHAQMRVGFNPPRHRESGSIDIYIGGDSPA